MAKVRITKTVETVKGDPEDEVVSKTTVSGPGGKILTDQQVEDWSRFAEKNQNLNFDQKWNAFSKMNPKFGATKQNVADALFNYRKRLTDIENRKIEGSYSIAPTAAQFGSKTAGLLNTGDFFLPILREGKVIGRDTEDLTPSSLYKVQPNPESAYISGIFKTGNQIPDFENVQPNSGVVDKASGIVRYLDNDGKEFAVNLVEVEKRPGYAEKLREKFSNELRTTKSTPEPQKLRIQKQ